MTTVMIALDNNESSHVARMAAKCFGSDADYLAIHVEDWRITIGWPWGVIAAAADDAAAGGYPATIVTADDAAAEARVISQRAGIAATPIGSLGDPATAILQAAKDRNVDVIVAGWHHRNWLKKLIAPSTPESLLAESTFPILFVPTKANAVPHNSGDVERQETTAASTAA